ncbi:MAG: hypothetical protein HYT49_03140 [Candidatus Wildermuthbacteria bacterium]|nr:hypothetical protein [Candidatus Wildermuthbacteria bacterium]
MEAYGITIEVDPQIELGKTFGQEENGHVGARLTVSEMPEQVALHIRPPQEGNPIIVFRGGAAEDARQFSLRVPLKWAGEGERRIPSLPDWKEEQNFLNVVLLNPDLHITDVQISLVIRGGNLYVVAQRVYQGWVRGTDGEMTFIPSQPAYAYPGMDYRAIWKDRGWAVALFAALEGLTRSTTLTEPTPAAWEPESNPADPDNVATIAYFNAITDSGLAIGDDGEEYQIFGYNLRGVKGAVKILPPLTRVVVDPLPRKEGYSRTPVRTCWPADSYE